MSVMEAPIHYSRYVAGADDDAALAAKREYVAQRRRAGLEPMSGYRKPQVRHVEGRAPVILLRPTQVAIVEALRVDGGTPATIARRAGVTVETVRRHLRVICSALGLEDRAELLAALLHGDVAYREVQ